VVWAIMFSTNDDRRTAKKFDMSRFIRWDGQAGVYDPSDALFLDMLGALPEEGAVKVGQSIPRPDQLSAEIYGDTGYWWIILSYNRLTSFLDLKPGTLIRYPSIRSLENLLYSINNKQSVQL
jgi:hypothetical protein